MKRLVQIGILIIGCWLLVTETARSQSIDSAEYFFDTDPGIGNGTPFATTAADTINDSLFVNTAGLGTGFHMLYFRVKDTNNTWSLYEGGSIYLNDTIFSTTASIDSAEYFFQTDPGVDSGMTVTITPGDTILDTVMISTVGLTPGFHDFYARVKDTSNIWSLYEKGSFYLYDTIAQAAAIFPPIDSAEYFYDTDPGIGNGMAFAPFATADTITASDTIPTAPLTGGTHRLYVRVRDTVNVWSLYEAASFVICNFIPVPDFTTDTVCVNNATTFTDLTTNLDTTALYTYGWDFTNDSITDDTVTGNTAYTFSTPGNHTVSLWVNNTNGCADTIYKTVYVDSLPVVTLTLPTDTMCKWDSLILSGGSPAGGTYSGLGITNGIFYSDSVSNGNHLIVYTYYNADSCSGSASQVLHVNPCSGIHEYAAQALQLTITPNPFRESTTIQIQNDGSPIKNMELQLVDIFGKTVRKLQVAGYRLQITRDALPSGVYFIKLVAEGKTMGTGKLVVID